jgi:uncharacterized paraquat-inducible protein A
MQRYDAGIDDAECPFCGCPVRIPAIEEASSWSCAACGALGRRRTQLEGPIAL